MGENNKAILVGLAMICSTFFASIFTISHYCYIGVMIGGKC